ncbi:hypothetical protein V2I01_18290 [Micromonospora sp. BRA006-A]|nr:hypothetical protein [Micromonospora sp. BRA006-A]
MHLAPEEAEADRFREQWRAWGNHLRLETIVSPYRSVIGRWRTTWRRCTPRART